MPATPEAPRHKVAVVGYTKSREETPWDDEEWEIWGCNNLWKFIDVEKATGWFDLHDLPTIRSDKEHDSWLRTAPLPVFVWDPQPEWPNAIAYPRAEILDAFGEFSGGRYFTNSISWMIAMALSHLILAGEDGKPPADAELGIYGVDMAQGSEYGPQRPSCEYWIGLAEAMGVQVTIPETSDLLKSAFLYGSDDGSNVLRAKLLSRQVELDEKFNACENEKNQLMARVNELVGLQNQVVGARDTGNYLLNVWMQPEGTRGGEDPLAEGTTDELGSA